MRRPNEDPESQEAPTLVFSAVEPTAREPEPPPSAGDAATLRRPADEAATLRRPADDAATLRRPARTMGLAATIQSPPVPEDATRVARPRRFDDNSERAPARLSGLDVSRPIESATFDQRYEARAVLGVGGMGEVRLCKDRLIGREVALKVMRREAAAYEEARERFVREARVQGQLEHPAIVPVYDIGVDPEGGAFFTMKRVRGRTLDAVIDALASGDQEASRKYSRRKLLTAFGSVCLAVDFAHAHGVLHRDIKPSNVILGDFGEVYVLDWGLAKPAGTKDTEPAGALELANDGAAPTMMGALVGTPGYMAPEQARGEVESLDGRADVYALGVLLFELLALEPLHPLANVDVAIASTLRGPDARPSERTMGEVPPELEAICVRATALDRNERYPSARHLSNAIERFLDGDRNIELRRDLSAAHVEAGRAALARANRGGEAAHEARTEALREVGSALALDPHNAEALATMAILLTDVSDDVPRAAEPELAAAAAAARRRAARGGANRYMMWSLFVPIAVWMGIRHWPFAAVVIGSILASGAFAFWLSRRNRVEVGHGVALMVLTSISIALMSAPFGPFILVPGLAATNTMFFAMSADRRGRLIVILSGMLAITIPWLLEVTGVVPPAYTFENSLLRVMPRVTELPALQAQICLLVTSVAMVIIPGAMAGRVRDALSLAERRLFLQAWHLRQLVPSEARGALANVRITKGQRGA